MIAHIELTSRAAYDQHSLTVVYKLVKQLRFGPSIFD
jgi:hypothetical protein